MTPATALISLPISRRLTRALLLVGAVVVYLLILPQAAGAIDLGPLTDGLGNAVDGVTETAEGLTEAVEEVTTTATETVEEVSTTATETVEEVTTTAFGLVEQTSPVVDLTPAAALVSDLGDGATEAAIGLLGTVAEAAEDGVNLVVEVVVDTVSETVGPVVEGVNPLLGETVSTIERVVEAAGVASSEIPAAATGASPALAVVIRPLLEEPLAIQVVVPAVATASLAPVSGSPSTPGAVPDGFSFAQPGALPAAASSTSEGLPTGTDATPGMLPPVQHGIGGAGGGGLTQTAAVLIAVVLLGLGISRWLRLLSDARPLNPFALPIAQPG
jgi:hypothetical protein